MNRRTSKIFFILALTLGLFLESNIVISPAPLRFEISRPVLAAEEQREFYVDSYYDAFNRSQIKASLLYTSEKAYFYVENKYLNTLSPDKRALLQEKITQLAEAFDKEIYPKLTKLFGDVWDPGIDNDPRVTILFTHLLDKAGGYFNPANELPKKISPFSNEREMVYLNTDNLFDSRLKSYLAHEFQHLISYNQKERINHVVDDIWLNELRSEYAPTYLGYDAANYQHSNLKSRVDKFRQYPSDSLTEWRGNVYDYASVVMFGQYLADHYGPSFFSALIRSPKTGIESINDALAKIGVHQNFDEIFGNWVVALYLNNTAEDKMYGYLNPFLKSFKVSPTATYQISQYVVIQRAGVMKEWAPFWYKIESNPNSDETLQVAFTGKPQRGKFHAKILKVDSAGNNIISDWNLTGEETSMFTIHHLGKGIRKIVIMPYVVYDGHYQNEKLPYNDFRLTIQAAPEGKKIQPLTVTPVKKISNSSQEVKITLYAPLPEGALVRAKGDYRVYIIHGDYRRHILSSKIFDFYGHLSWAKVRIISQEQLNEYQESRLVRVVGDKKVYDVDEHGVKHWLHMSADEFRKLGGKWDSVYIINQEEGNFYQTGLDYVQNI